MEVFCSASRIISSNLVLSQGVFSVLQGRLESEGTTVLPCATSCLQRGAGAPGTDPASSALSVRAQGRDAAWGPGAVPSPLRETRLGRQTAARLPTALSFAAQGLRKATKPEKNFENEFDRSGATDPHSGFLRRSGRSRTRCPSAKPSPTTPTPRVSHGAPGTSSRRGVLGARPSPVWRATRLQSL